MRPEGPSLPLSSARGSAPPSITPSGRIDTAGVAHEVEYGAITSVSARRLLAVDEGRVVGFNLRLVPVSPQVRQRNAAR